MLTGKINSEIGIQEKHGAHTYDLSNYNEGRTGESNRESQIRPGPPTMIGVY